MTTEFEFGKAPRGFDVAGGFDDSCRLRISGLALQSADAGRLRVVIRQMLASRLIQNVTVDVAAAHGQLALHIGDSNHRVAFEEGSNGLYELRLWRSSAVRVGRGTTSNGTRIVCDLSDVSIGDDCMFSDGILIQGADQHGIVDLESGAITNNRPRKTTISDHVWLGRNCVLLPDVSVGEGSIIAAGAIVTRPVPATCAAAGVPARVVKSKTTWSRSPLDLDPLSRHYVERNRRESAISKAE